MPGRSTLSLAAVLVLASLLAVPAVLAGEGDAPPAAKAPADDAVRAAWVKFKAAQGEAQEAFKEKDREKMQATSSAAQAAQKEFGTAFAASDWNAWDPGKDEELLTIGLMYTANTAMSAGDPKTAIRACETFLAKLPKAPTARGVSVRLLPSAHLKNGDVAKAAELWEKASDDEDPSTRAGALLNLGDLRAAKGEFEAARATWKHIGEIKPAEAPPAAAGGRRPPDLLGSLKTDAEARLALVGHPAPEIDSKTWLGGEAKPLSAHKGQVVVVDFWATWCPPCRQVMPSLNATYIKRRGEGLAVLGVTRVYDHGFLPKPGTKEPMTDGEQIRPLPADQFPAHLETFKKNLAIDYPFVTATQAEFDAYKVRGIPTLVVIGRDGNVAFLKVGSGDETLLELAISRALGGPQK